MFLYIEFLIHGNSLLANEGNTTVSVLVKKIEIAICPGSGGPQEQLSSFYLESPWQKLAGRGHGMGHTARGSYRVVLPPWGKERDCILNLRDILILVWQCWQAINNAHLDGSHRPYKIWPRAVIGQAWLWTCLVYKNNQTKCSYSCDPLTFIISLFITFTLHRFTLCAKSLSNWVHINTDSTSRINSRDLLGSRRRESVVLLLTVSVLYLQTSFNADPEQHCC